MSILFVPSQNLLIHTCHNIIQTCHLCSGTRFCWSTPECDESGHLVSGHSPFEAVGTQGSDAASAECPGGWCVCTISIKYLSFKPLHVLLRSIYYVEKMLSTKWLRHEVHTCEHMIYMHSCILLLAQECFCVAKIYANIMLVTSQCSNA